MAKDINKKPFDEETELKLEIFAEYFRAWLPVAIHSPHVQTIHVFDFFAGSGTDVEGNLGSALRLLNESKGEDCKNCGSLNKPIYFYFNDSIKKKAKELKKHCDNFEINCSRENCKKNCKFNVKVLSSQFEDLFNNSEVQSILENPRNANFLLLDQYGFKHTDSKVFRKLISYPMADFIFFISSSTIRRFREVPVVQKYIDTANLDFDEGRYIECHRAITDYYRSLIPVGEEFYLHHFTIRKKANYYGLIFGSQHTLGMEKFLEVSWKKDVYSGESNFNIDDDWTSDSLFYKGEGRSKKREAVKREIRQQILSESIADNIDGLKYALSKGCRPVVFTEVMKELEKEAKVYRQGTLNWASTNIHKVRRYTIHLNGVQP